MAKRRAVRLALAALFSLAAFPSPGLAQNRVPDLGLISLEDLMKLEITSASRRVQRVEETPAAVYVITQEDIQRSGTHLLPELLRLVPGMQVSQIGASEWAVSIRGFNSRYANKVLVLVDGRSIYNRAFTGVFWSSQEMMVDDIDRIEVIRGPGGAMWGSDAVNGVINIITKTAAATQGGLVQVGAGTFDGSQGAARYGGRLGSAAYRLYSQWSWHQPAVLAGSDASAGDGWSNSATGVRVDWTAGADAFLIEGTIIDSSTSPLMSGRTGTAAIPAVNASTDAWHHALLGRWTHTTARGTLQMQSFFNRNVTGPAGAGATDRNGEKVADLDVQYHPRSGGRHEVVLGAGYRYSTDYNVPVGQLSVDPPSSAGSITNMFAQDEIALTTRVRVTLGSKVERDSGTGWNVQPTTRVLWDVGRSGQHLWAAASHAVRTPAPYDRFLQIRAPLPPTPDGVPVTLAISGNPEYANEQLDELEAGYRVNVKSKASLDVSTFKGRYDRLPSLHPLPTEVVPSPAPHVVVRQQFSNSLNANASGLEISGRFRPLGALAIDASYSHLDITRTIDAGSVDSPNPNFTDNSPTDQWEVRLSSPFGPHVEIGASLFHAGRISSLKIPAYTRVDLGATVRLSGQLSLVAAGENLLQASHIEAVQNSLATTGVPRSGSLHVVWRSAGR